MGLLPTEKTPIKRDIRDFSILLYGENKIGKSTWASQAEGAIFISTEPGLNSLEVFQVPCHTWSTFLELCVEIKQGDHHYRTVVIDTIDNLYRMCLEHTCKQFNVKTPSEGDSTDIYGTTNKLLNRMLTGLALLPYGLILISHAKEKQVKTRLGKVPKITPTLSDGATRVVMDLVDFILYAGLEDVTDNETGAIVGTERVIHCQPTTIYEAGNRSQFAIPDPLPLDYHAFAAALAAGLGAKDAPAKTTRTGEKK
jgi:hypothetical protein